MMWSSNDMGWGGWIMMTAGTLVILALVVVAIIALLPAGRENRSLVSGGPGLDDPLRILDERFARGEIDLEDYQARRASLSDKR